MSAAIWDMAVVGAGPGGMQAAIAASSEGLKTLVLERAVVGGQIGQTPLLENSVFAAGGITGPQFAGMMRQQAETMGATIQANDVIGLKWGANKTKSLVLAKGNTIKAHTVVLAMGNKWTELDIPGLRAQVNKRVFLGPVKAINYDAGGRALLVYGGGPSAGQAVIALANKDTTSVVYHVMRSDFRMPQYLVDRIMAHPKVKIIRNVTIDGIKTSRHETGVVCSMLTSMGLSIGSGLVDAVFMCNGLTPATDWLDGTLERDETGHIITTDLETSMAGVYAIGDCRAGSTPRVGVAIGDGSMAVTKAWAYFKARPVCAICPSIFGPTVVHA